MYVVIIMLMPTLTGETYAYLYTEWEITSDIRHFLTISCVCLIRGLFGLPLCLSDNLQITYVYIQLTYIHAYDTYKLFYVRSKSNNVRTNLLCSDKFEEHNYFSYYYFLLCVYIYMYIQHTC